jgi:ABC-type multidrug transport system ATPase subunit
VVESSADATIDEECARIGEIQDFSNYPLICSGLTKQYDTGKLAVNNLNLVVEDKTIFGLLGPNGAGKTTLLSMITGIFSPTSGTAFVGGYSIIDQIDKVHLEMGVCPQFDILWPTLTVEEHLYFYARLRGVGGANEKTKVQETLEEVNL